MGTKRIELTDAEIAALGEALGRTQHEAGGPSAPAALPPQELSALRGILARAAEGQDGLRITDWFGGDIYVGMRPGTVGKLKDWVGQALANVLPDESLFKGEDGRYYAVRVDAWVEEDLDQARDTIDNILADAADEGDLDRVESLKGHLAALASQGGAPANGWVPATGKPRRAYLDDGEIAALLAALDGTGQAGPAPQSLAGLRAKLERVAGRGSVLLVECVLGDDYKEAVPCKAGRLAYVNEGYFSQVWHEVLPAVLFRAEDGRYCALRLDLDIVEADLCDAWWLVKDRLHADEWDGVEEGDAAQVEYLKGHLAALEAQAAEAGLAVADRKAAWAGPEGAAAGS